MRINHEKATFDTTIGTAVNKEYDLNRDSFLKSYNIHPAKVVTLKDPYRSGNIGIRIAGVHEDGVTNRPQDVLFAPMLMPFGGGDNYGFFAMPPIGSDVMVAFIDGDLKNPIILGAWQSRKMIKKNMTSQDEVSSTLNYSKARAMQSVSSPNNLGSVVTNSNPVENLATNIKSYIGGMQNMAIGKLSSNALSMVSNFVKGGEFTSQLSGILTPNPDGSIPGIPKGLSTAFSDMMNGKIGQVPGFSDTIQGLNINLDSQFGTVLTDLTNTLGTVAQTSVDTITAKIAQGTAQANILLDKLNIQDTLATALKTNVMDMMTGAPGLLQKGLNNLKSNLLSGAISPAISATLNQVNSISPQLGSAIASKITSSINSSLSQATSLNSLNSTLDNVLKQVKFADKAIAGGINITDAIKAVDKGSVEYELAKDDEQAVSYIFGPQCPLPYRNQLPSRNLEELGENFSQGVVDNDKQEIDSCYLSTDKKDENNGKYITPEPVVYMWKSPEGSSIEIDDTGYANENSDAKGLDNRGVRLTTKKGALLHLIDEKNYEGILLRDKNNNYIWIDSVTNTIHMYAQNGVSEETVADRNFNCLNKRQMISGDKVQVIKKDKKDTISGNHNNNINQNLIENIGGAWSIVVHGNANIYSNKDVSVTAANKCIIGGAIHTIIEGNRIDMNSGI
jgi:hypothetical protein